MNRLASTLAVAAALAAAPALAQQPMPNWYIGGGFGVGNLGKSGTEITGLANASLDDSDTTYTVRGGYRFNPYLALEVGYYDLGKYAFSGTSGSTAVSGTAKATSWGLSVVGILPINQFDLYARLGFEESKLEANANTTLATGERGRHPDRRHLRHRGPMELQPQLGRVRRVDEERQDPGRQLPHRRRLPLLSVSQRPPAPIRRGRRRIPPVHMRSTICHSAIP